ncbi:MAG: hypothetical protein ABIK15_17705 [Pseudomonadota bacterium]|nr:MAG: hypothetical protein C4522_12230 [Desulfobacteraceae bacterium]
MRRKNLIEGEKVSLQGIIIPSDWDQTGKVVAYTLSTFDEKEYRIHPKSKNPSVEQFMGEKVFINGILQKKEHDHYLYVDTIRLF